MTDHTHADVSMLAVRVTPLVWAQSGGSHAMDGESHTVPSEYTIRYADENGWKWQASGIGAYGWEPSPTLAKAAAQSERNTRIMAAIELAPDPRDAVIAQLVDALYAIEMWDAARGYPIPYRHRDPMRTALAAAKAVM